MKKNTRNILIVLLVIVALGLAVLILSLTAEKTEDTPSSSATEFITLIEEKEEDLESVKITNEDGTYVIDVKEEVEEPSSEDADDSEPKVDYVYSIASVDPAMAQTNRIESAAAIGLTLSAARNLGPQDRLEEFGLIKPAVTAEIAYRDGTSHIVKYGNQAADGSGYYYVMVDDDENVYMASATTGVMEAIGYYVRATMFDLKAEEATGIYYATYIHMSGSEMPEEVEIHGGDDYVYKMTSPKKAGANDEKVQAIIDGIAEMSALGVASPDVSEESLKKHGLLEPAGVLKFTLKEGEPQTFTVSAVNEKGTRYATLNDIQAIFEVNDADVTTWLGQSVLSLQSTLNLLPNIMKVSKMELTLKGKEFAFVKDREENPESSTETQIAYTYTVKNKDGEELDYDTNFRHFYRALITNYIIEDYREMPEGDPVFTCTYHYYDSSDTDSIAFYKVSDRRYCVVENGEDIKGLISPNDVERAMEYLVLLNDGEDVPEVY